MTDTALDDSLTAKDVADYLRRHPGFLNEFPELAAQLELPREQGQVASLAAYQTQNLREKNAELERRLAELAAIAAENERLMLRIHELNVAVLRANTAAVAARSVIARLAEDFQTDQVRLLVFDLELPPADWLVRAPGGQASLPEFAEFFAHHEPIAGRLSAERLYRLFGDEAPQIQSSALMPLDGLGLLAIGSRDPDRFQPGMGTVFLKMISATVTAALQRSRNGG
ncbi:DUF484 family protein [Dyella marensis]|jgi:uncharacterized protein YigA (DUF484 family)|uniref:DUF484 family protein n=1 Tax=Dyella marensis TaxID=500610 RepID=A0A1I2K1A1_9GAMM|nr:MULTISPECIES: DUF484 family protein [Dyella]SFF59970.1 hypothetical protein SAMN02799615_04334 [Dyella marensis]